MVLLAKALVPTVERAVAALGAPQAVVGIIIAPIVHFVLFAYLFTTTVP